MATEKDSIPFSSLFSPADVICQTGETERDGILLKMLRQLSQQHNIGNIEDAYEAVLAREKDLATVVGPGLAMPHARLDTIDEIVMAMATSRKGIVFDPNKSDNPVKLIVLTLVAKVGAGSLPADVKLRGQDLPGCVHGGCRGRPADAAAGVGVLRSRRDHTLGSSKFGAGWTRSSE